MAINLIDKIKPANNGTFPMVDAADVEMPDGSRLSDQFIMKVVDELPDDAANHPNVLYLVVEEEAGHSSGGGDAP